MKPRNRPGRPPKGRAESIDDELLNAARDSFCTHGISGVSMDDVARAAGVTKQTIYRRYPSKAALVDAVVERDIQQLAVESCIDTAQPLWRLKARAWRYFTFLIDPSNCQFSRFLGAEAAYSEALRVRMEDWHQTLTRVMDGEVADAQAVGAIKPGDVKRISRFLSDVLGSPSNVIRFGLSDPFIGMTPEAFFEDRWTMFLTIWAQDVDAAQQASQCVLADLDA